jgi:hypothetical protein
MDGLGRWLVIRSRVNIGSADPAVFVGEMENQDCPKVSVFARLFVISK